MIISNWKSAKLKLQPGCEWFILWSSRNQIGLHAGVDSYSEDHIDKSILTNNCNMLQERNANTNAWLIKDLNHVFWNTSIQKHKYV